MSSDQIQTLQNDSEELRVYADKLLKKGRQDVAAKIMKKREYLENFIAAVQAA
jgi:phage shock protein A